MIRNSFIAICILTVCGWTGQYTAVHGDSVYADYLSKMPEEQQQCPYYLTVIIRYDDIAYQKFTLLVKWHYFSDKLNKYWIIPVDGRPFAVDNVEPIQEGVTK
jgi:hypothetical protein